MQGARGLGIPMSSEPRSRCCSAMQVSLATVNSEEESRLRAAAEAATAAAFPELSGATAHLCTSPVRGAPSPGSGGGRRSPAVSIAQPSQQQTVAAPPLQPAFSPDDDDIADEAAAAGLAALGSGAASVAADREAAGDDDEASLAALGEPSITAISHLPQHGRCFAAVQPAEGRLSLIGTAWGARWRITPYRNGMHCLHPS